jgi:hypothetical protein
MATIHFDRAVWLRRGRITAISLAIFLVIVGVVGFFVVPGIVKSVAEKQIGEQLGRKATIGAVKFNPYLLAATIDDFTLYEADGTTVAVKIDELYADISSSSLFRRALVFDQLKVTKPLLHVVRLEPQRFSFSDILDKLAAQPKSDSPSLFSLNNIEIDGGVLDIDDRVTSRKHRVEDLRIALPFISNLPYDTTIFVTPEFAAKIDGSAIGVRGKAQPFSASREAAIELDIAALDLTEYVDLSPTRLPFKLASGKLSAKLALTFKATTRDEAGKTVPQSAGVAGYVGLAALEIADLQGHRTIAAKSIDIDIRKIDPFNSAVVLQRIAIDEPAIDATRRADGSFDLVDLFRMPHAETTAAPPAPATTSAAPQPTFTIASVRIDHGRLHIVDQTLAKAATTDLKDINLEAGAISLTGTTPTTFKVAIAADDDATLAAEGSAIVEKKDVTGSITVKGFKPARIAPYLASVLAARIDDGSVDFSARYHVDASGPAPVGLIDQIAVRVDKLRTSLPDEKAVLVGAEAIALDGGSFDLATRTFTAESLHLAAPAIAIKRDAKGRINLRAALVEARPVATPPSAPKAAQGAAVEVVPVAAKPFTAVIKSVAIERGDFAFEDLAVPTPVHVRAQPFNLKAENIGTATDAVIPFALDTGFDKRGKLAVKGKVSIAPLSVDATIDANQVAVGWLAAYAGDKLNIVIESADLNTKGTLRVTQEKTQAKAANAPISVAYRGSLGVARMRALDKLTSEEFVQWKTLDIPLLDLRMPANAPLSVTLGNVALNDFYARVIVNANGRLNLQEVVAAPGQQQSVTTPETGPAPPPTTAPTTAPAAAAPKPVIHVAGVKLTNGRVGITDNFIKPNYSANLTDLNGEVAAIASDDPKPADLKLTGRIDGEGTLDVSGKINPLAATLYTDIAAEAKDIELTRLTPYAIKYAGYAINRGKLSMTVKYHIENGKLDASNHLFLDQLTFGDHDASSTANLPVRLAVALLSNAKGEINIELPISGSLSDPQFSIGGVLWRVFVNLITRAVTSPFALIGSAFGGGSDGELGYIQFKPGVSDLTDMGKTKLETLAKALGARPALKLDIIGRYDPATDPDGIKRDHLLDRMKDLKAKDQSKGGERVGRNDVTIEAGAEYAKYLAQVYDDTKLPDKPRNVVGLAKTIPTEEMEKLLMANTPLDANDPRWLADARADVVRHYIEDTGKIPPGRVFLVTPKLNADGINDKGVPNRVDFAIR